MSPRHPRFVTACQQLLVIGVICAALTPAANVISLELVPRDPSGSAAAGSGTAAPRGVPALGSPSASMAAYAKATTLKAEVPTTVTESVVSEYSLTAPAGARMRADALAVSSRRTTSGTDVVISDPQPVTGYGAVGVTWSGGSTNPPLVEGEIDVQVRTKDDGVWSAWGEAHYSEEHGPDPDSQEAVSARPGTDELLVGEVDEVQVRVDTEGSAPADLRLAVIDPGAATSTEREDAEIDTAALPRSAATTTPTPAPAPAPAPTPVPEPTPAPDGTDVPEDTGTTDTTEDTGGDLGLAAATYTPKPQIFSRAQWGANESLRDPGSLRYFEVHAGFVHHTVNANAYKKRDVPAILRGIYAYHTQSRGWSDVGYNFLVDRFGRVWEGRYGGVGRPVVGAHTLGYNEESFAMSAIGNFEEVRPSEAMIQAYGAVFAWKLSLHGVKAGSKRQSVASATFPAINGHRDAGTTACPGAFLYDRLGDIRSLAKQAQVGFAGRQLESDVVAGSHPDVLVRRASDNRAVLIPIKKTRSGDFKAGRPIALSFTITRATRILNAGDWNRDGHADIITRSGGNGRLLLRPGLGKGEFGPAQRLADGFGGIKLLAAVGDMTGDGFPDLMGQPKKGKPMMIYPGRGNSGIGTPYVAYSKIRGSKQIGVGRWDKGGAPDTLVRRGSTLSLYLGNGPGGLTGSRQLPIDVSPYDWIVGISDVGLKGHPDLVLRAKDSGQLYLVQGYKKSVGEPILLGGGYRAYDMVE